MKYKDNLYNLVGELTIKDITRPIKFQANVDINGLNFSAQSKLKIDRTKWDITYSSGNYIKDLGDKAILDEIEFVLLQLFKVIVTVGALSSSVIVMVTSCGVLFSATPDFPDTPLIEIVAVSFDVAS